MEQKANEAFDDPPCHENVLTIRERNLNGTHEDLQYMALSRSMAGINTLIFTNDITESHHLALAQDIVQCVFQSNDDKYVKNDDQIQVSIRYIKYGGMVS